MGVKVIDKNKELALMQKSYMLGNYFQPNRVLNMVIPKMADPLPSILAS